MDEMINRLKAIINDEEFLNEVIVELFRKYEMDENNEITLGPFRTIMDDIYEQIGAKKLTEVEAICIFEQFDKDHSGLMGAREIAGILKNFLEYYVTTLEQDHQT